MSAPAQLSFEDTETAFRHLTYGELHKATRLFRLLNNGSLARLGSSLTELAVKLHLPITPFVKPIIFDHFCGGETLEETKRVVNKLATFDMGVMGG
jgi:proline dehydrogenase